MTELHGTRQEAVGALMGRFATREDEVDDLFRLGVFVDLYRVVREWLMSVTQIDIDDDALERAMALSGLRVRPGSRHRHARGRPEPSRLSGSRERRAWSEALRS